MANIKISGLPSAALPLDGPNSFFEVQTIEAGVEVSRKVASDDLTLAAGITIEDEGVPLATLADTLDFVGAGVVASGVGSTKTITIPGGQVNSVVGGTNISVNVADPVNPVVNLDAAITGVSVNGVTLSNGGAATDYLDETGAYSTPAGFDPTADQTITGQYQFNLPIRYRYTTAVADSPGVGQVHANGDDLFFVDQNGVSTSLLGGGGGVNTVTGGSNITNSGTAADPILDVDDPLIIASVNMTSALAVSSVGAPYDNVPINIGANLVGTMGMTQLSRQNIQTKPSGFGFNSTLFININGAGTAGSDTIIGGLNSAQLQVQFGVDVSMQHGSSATQVFVTDAVGIRLPVGSMFVTEKAAAAGDVAGDGQFWVRNDVPNVPMFTDDTGVDFQLNTGFDPTANAVISGSWEFTNTGGVEFGPSCELQLRNNADTSNTFIQNLGPTLQFGIAGGDFGSGVFEINQSSFARVECPPIFIGEQAAAEADIGGDGQIWVESLVPNTLMFTDDSGIDMRVSTVQWFNNFGGQQTVNNSTTFVNITQLSGFQLDANSVYHIEIFLKTNQASVTPDLALRLNRQGAGTFTDENWQITSISATNVFTFQDTNVHTALGAVQDQVGNHVVHIIGIVDVGVADLWDLQFAQQIATAANTLMDDASYVKVTKIGPGP